MKENRKFHGVWIPKEIWLNKDLDIFDKVIFTEIDSFSDDDINKCCYASNEYFANFCGCSTSKVSKSIKKLKDLGYIEQVSFDGRHRYLKSRIVNLTKQTSTKKEAEEYKNDAINIKENIKDYSSSSKEQIVDLLQDNGFIISPLQYETIDSWCDYDYELIKYVLLQSLNNNIRNINYIDKVLFNYSKKGIITKEQAIADDEIFKKKKSSVKEKEEKHGIYDNLAEL